MEIKYITGECAVGSVLMATTSKGICAIYFGNAEELKINLQLQFPSATLVPTADLTSDFSKVIQCINNPRSQADFLLDIQGTSFQKKVWEALRKIPVGKTLSYKELAVSIGHPKSTRAVANACGANKIAALIPCHRIIRQSGALSGYRWGVEVKQKLLIQESFKTYSV